MTYARFFHQIVLYVSWSYKDMVIFEEAASATIRAEGGGSLDGGRQSRMMMLDKERRRQLLDYFVYRPPPMTLEDEEKQDRDSRVVGKAGGRYTWASHPDRYEREETIRNPNPNLNPNPNRIQSAPPSPRRSPPLKASHVSPDLIRRRGGDGGVQSQGGLVELREGSFGVNRAALGEERAVRPEVYGLRFRPASCLTPCLVAVPHGWISGDDFGLQGFCF